MDAQSEDRVLEVLVRLWAVHHGLQAVSKWMLARLGVTAPQRAVLRMASRHDGITPGELSRLLHTHPSTLTGVLRRLEGLGLIYRTGDPSDARKMRLHVQPSGEAICNRTDGTVESALRRAVERMNGAQVEALISALAIVAEELENTARSARLSG